MAIKVNLSDVEMKPHPKFEGVKIGFVCTKERHPELSITVLEISPGVEVPTHSHEIEIDSILTLEGEGEVFINGEWQPFKAGDIVVIGNREVHGVRVKGERPAKCYIVHAPALW